MSKPANAAYCCLALSRLLRCGAKYKVKMLTDVPYRMAVIPKTQKTERRFWFLPPTRWIAADLRIGAPLSPIASHIISDIKKCVHPQHWLFKGRHLGYPPISQAACSADSCLLPDTGDQFPEEGVNDAFGAMHGSWNRMPPSGCNIR